MALTEEVRSPRPRKALIPAVPPPVPLAEPAPLPEWILPTREEWQTMPAEECHQLIQRLRACYEEGAQVLNQRNYDEARESGNYVCMVCRKKKAMTIDNHPNYVWKDDRQDPITKVYTSRIICSSECYFRGANSGKMTNAGIAADVKK